MEPLTIKRSAIGSASGSIDLFGGYAKAAGSMALRAMSDPQTTVLLTETNENILRISSTRHGRFAVSKNDFDTLARHGFSLSELRLWLVANQAPLWSYHVAGAAFLFAARHRWVAEGGLSFAVASDIPEGQGLSSGAALKVACLRALEKLTTFHTLPREMDTILERIDTELLGIPFDPTALIASSQNRPGCLLPINCRENVAQSPIELPRGITIFSWTKRLDEKPDKPWHLNRATAAAMGWRIAQPSLHDSAPGLPKPAVFESSLSHAIPETILGRDFELQYGPLRSTYSRVAADTTYHPRDALAFSIRENRRCDMAIHLLSNMGLKFRRRTMEALGDLLWESHFECRAAGLRLELADAMIEALAKSGPDFGIFGGRLDYSGSHCTVIALAEKKAIAALRRLAREVCPENSEPFQIL